MKYKIQAKQKTDLETFQVKMLTDGVYISVDDKDVTVNDFYKDYMVNRDDAQLLEDIEEVYTILNLSDGEFGKVFDNNQEKDEWTVFEYNFAGPETYDYLMECEQQRARSLAEIIQEVLEEKELKENYRCKVELGNNAKVILKRRYPGIERSSDDILRARGYESMHKFPIMECDDRIIDIHEKEIDTIFESLYKEPLFSSALTIRAECVDVAYKDFPVRYYVVPDVGELSEHLYGYDFKNGCDFGITKEGSLAIAIYGRGYEYKGADDNIKVLLHIDPVKMLGRYGEITKQRYDSLVRKDASTQLQSIKATVEKEIKKMYKEKQNEYEKRR